MIIKAFILAAFIRLLIATDKPFLCSGLYAALVLVIGLLGITGGRSILVVIVATALSFLLASLYFYLWDRVVTGTMLWWFIASVGLAIGLV